MKLHNLLPLFRDWCTICRTYAEQENGMVTLPIPLGPITGPIDVTSIPSIPTETRSITRCRNCGWANRY